jgi:hypothetical protein
MDNQPMSRKAPPIGSAPQLRADAPVIVQTSPAQPAPARRAGRKADDPESLGLRKLWEHVEKEPVPDSMLALLDAIDAARSPDSKQASDPDAPPSEPGDAA